MHQSHIEPHVGHGEASTLCSASPPHVSGGKRRHGPPTSIGLDMPPFPTSHLRGREKRRAQHNAIGLLLPLSPTSQSRGKERRHVDHSVVLGWTHPSLHFSLERQRGGELEKRWKVWPQRYCDVKNRGWSLLALSFCQHHNNVWVKKTTCSSVTAQT